MRRNFTGPSLTNNTLNEPAPKCVEPQILTDLEVLRWVRKRMSELPGLPNGSRRDRLEFELRNMLTVDTLCSVPPEQTIPSSLPSPSQEPEMAQVDIQRLASTSEQLPDGHGSPLVKVFVVMFAVVVPIGWYLLSRYL